MLSSGGDSTGHAIPQSQAGGVRRAALPLWLLPLMIEGADHHDRSIGNATGKQADHPAAGDERPTIRELEILRAMIASGKTVAAGHALGLSQPAVSRALAALEGKIGRALFVRDGARLLPTAAALALEREGSQVLAALDRLSARAQPLRPVASIRISAAPTMAQFLLPRAVAAFRAQEPGLTIEVDIGKGSDVLAAVADRQADMGIADGQPAHPALRAEPLRDCIAHAIVPADHRLARYEVVGPPDMAGEAFVALARRFPSRTEFDRLFEMAGVPVSPVAEVSTSAFAVQLVRAGFGIALLNPFPLSLGGLDGLTAIPFTPRVPYRTQVLMPLSGVRNPVARRFADFLKQFLPDDGVSQRPL